MIAGLGEGLGVALAGAFAEAGHDIVGLSRTGKCDPAAHAVVARNGRHFSELHCDLAREAETAEMLAPVAETVDLVLHLSHELRIAPLGGLTAEDYEQVWRATCLSAFNLAKVLAPAMAARGHGTLIFCGATASIRGAARFAAFASAKFALRGLTQSLARELGPQGLHVVHLVLDGLIDAPQTNRRFGQAMSLRMNPADIASACVALARQPPSAWTHELDLRPAGEAF